MKKVLIIFLIVGCTSDISFAQRNKTTKKPASNTQVPVLDTTRPRTVTVTSEYKPVLLNAAKINFSAASPLPDSTLPTLQYAVPAQNLFFTFEPSPLKPLAAYIDTSIQWENKNFIKAGYGNYSTPFLQAGFSLGDGTNSIVNIHAKHTYSKGSIPFQQFSKTHADIIGIFNPSENIEWSGKLFFDNNSTYLYGFRPDTLKFEKEDIRQRFSTFGGKVSLRNKTINSTGINYNPSIFIDAFSDNHSGRESNFILSAPVSKSFGKKLTFNLGLTADITSYKTDTIESINNNLFYLTPSLQFGTPNFKIIAGIIPSWDNSAFNMLPNFSAEVKLNEEKFILQAGWIGYYNKTTYESLANFNPWLQQPTVLLNTKVKEQYAGFKGSAGDHFTYNAKVSYLNFTNHALFVNDTLTGKSFQVINEPTIKDIRLHGELGYTVQEKFSLLAGATFNQYSGLKENEKAWGLLPIEINGALRWNIMKDVLLKSDIYFWDGARYRTKDMKAFKLKPALDLNAGVEFGIIPKLDFWIQFNNLLNNHYQRWNQYEVLGFNVVGGIVYSFAQTSK